MNSQSLQETQVGYILQKCTSLNYTLEKFALAPESFVGILEGIWIFEIVSGFGNISEFQAFLTFICIFKQSSLHIVFFKKFGFSETLQIVGKILDFWQLLNKIPYIFQSISAFK